jgi:hypothetical protein
MVLELSMEDWVYKALTTDNEISISEDVLNIFDMTVKYIYEQRMDSSDIYLKHIFNY